MMLDLHLTRNDRFPVRCSTDRFIQVLYVISIM